MKKRMALSIRSLIYIYILLMIVVAESIFILKKWYIKELSIHYSYLLLMCVTIIITVVLFYYSVLLPYIRIKKLFQLFVNQQVYEELFEVEDFLTPELKLVMERFHHLLNKQDAINISKKQAEYLALQNQINPHFLYNTLEAIRGDALYEGMINIAETTEALATFFRYTVAEVENLVTLEDEIENIENYFTIQRYRFGEKFKMKMNYPENEDDILQLQLPKLTLQPIVENAIFHGLEGKIEEGNISINIETTTSSLLVSIIDDGIGMPWEEVEEINKRLEKVAVSYISDDKAKHGGIALRNVSRRIKLLFGEEYGLHIYSTLNFGTDVRITLPKIKSS